MILHNQIESWTWVSSSKAVEKFKMKATWSNLDIRGGCFQELA
jgi:hypothetical protein